MTIEVKHKFQSLKGDGSDLTQVQPSNWNDTHDMTMATGKVLGRATVGVGPVEELPAGTAGLSLLAAATSADLAALGLPTTGDIKLTLKNVADSGWLLFNDTTFGSAASGATSRSDSYQALYLLLWANISNTYAPVTGGRSGTALADWLANKPMALPKMLGRALAIAGSGTGLTARSLGEAMGAETTTLTAAQIPAHTHPNSLNDPGHSHPVSPNPGGFFGSGGNGGASGGSGIAAAVVIGSTTGITITNAANTGGGGAHTNMQPTSFLNAMVKV